MIVKTFYAKIVKTCIGESAFEFIQKTIPSVRYLQIERNLNEKFLPIFIIKNFCFPTFFFFSSTLHNAIFNTTYNAGEKKTTFLYYYFFYSSAHSNRTLSAYGCLICFRSLSLTIYTYVTRYNTFLY